MHFSDAQMFFYCKVHCGEQPKDSMSAKKKKKCWIFVQKRATDYTTFLSVGFILQSLATSYTTFLSVGFILQSLATSYTTFLSVGFNFESLKDFI